MVDLKIDLKTQEFKEGIFSLNTRRFGKVAELMIKKLNNLKNPTTNAYDLLGNNSQKIEVKFSRVLKKCNSTIVDKNLITQVINSNVENRMLTYLDARKNNFDCNIQQVKPKEFDILYYGCFFEDKIMICKINSEQIALDDKINYSDHQHRGNIGEGQFHINNSTIDNHLEKYLVEWITYDEIIDLFK